MKSHLPERIVCLTEETTETIYLLGEEDRLVGISGFTVRPKRARKEKPIISTFIDAKIEEIIDLKPDLVIGFSDIQAEIAKELIAKGISVWVNNYRGVDGILNMVYQLSTLLDKKEAGLKIISEFEERKSAIELETKTWTKKPIVYFEEWYDPLISGIQWVSELIEMAGGKDAFSELSQMSLAKDRIIANPDDVLAREPDIILASWCGKKYKAERMFKRKDWKSMNAYQNKQYFEIDSSIILQPGPAAIFEGLDIMHHIFKNWQLQQ